VFTRALHWSLSWARSIQSIPSHPISLRSILILSTHLRLCLPVVSFLLAFPPISWQVQGNQVRLITGSCNRNSLI
jgi:hypothetical protein